MPEAQVYFRGKRVGGFTVFGPVTKRSYRFSNYARYVMVDERDVPGIVQDQNFTLVGKALPQTPRPIPRGSNPSLERPLSGPPTAPRRQEGVAEDNRQRPVVSQQQPVSQAARQAAQEAVSTQTTTLVSKPKNPVGRPRRSQVADRNTTKVNPATFGVR